MDSERSVCARCVWCACWEQVLNGKSIAWHLDFGWQWQQIQCVLFLAGIRNLFFPSLLLPSIEGITCIFVYAPNVWLGTVKIHWTGNNDSTNGNSDAWFVLFVAQKHLKAERGFSTISNARNVCSNTYFSGAMHIKCPRNDSKCICHAFVVLCVFLSIIFFVVVDHLCTHKHFITASDSLDACFYVRTFSFIFRWFMLINLSSS